VSTASANSLSMISALVLLRGEMLHLKLGFGERVKPYARVSTHSCLQTYRAYRLEVP
jgi:hypothetical protein